MNRTTHRPQVAAALIAAVLTSAAAASAAAPTINPAPDGEIHSCFTNRSGRVRLVDPTSPQGACKRTESPLIWAQQGPVGPQGPAGVNGIQYVYWGATIPANTGTTFQSTCPLGLVPIGGGFSTGATIGVYPTISAPNIDQAGTLSWRIRINNGSSNVAVGIFYVICTSGTFLGEVAN